MALVGPVVYLDLEAKRAIASIAGTIPRS